MRHFGKDFHHRQNSLLRLCWAWTSTLGWRQTRSTFYSVFGNTFLRDWWALLRGPIIGTSKSGLGDTHPSGPMPIPWSASMEPCTTPSTTTCYLVKTRPSSLCFRPIQSALMWPWTWSSASLHLCPQSKCLREKKPWTVSNDEIGKTWYFFNCYSSTQTLSLYFRYNSEKHNDFASKQTCLNAIIEEFGRNPLKESLVRFDPILFKDPVSNVRKKYRKMEVIPALGGYNGNPWLHRGSKSA